MPRPPATPVLHRPAAQAILAFGIFVLVVALSNGPLKASILDFTGYEVSADIGVEHAIPADLGLAITVGSSPGMAEFTGDAHTPLQISVPEAWVLREVRNARLDDLHREEPVFGFRRLLLPPGAVLSYRIPRSPDRLILHHPGSAPLQLNVRSINLETHEAVRDIFLVQERELVMELKQ